MQNHGSRPLLSALLAAALLLSYAAPAAAQKDDKKKDDKAAAQKAAPPQSKQEREYQKIKQFALERYSRNPEFKDEVDESLRQKQREHSEYAFNINTLDSDDDQILRSAERMRILDTLYDNPLAQDYVNRVGQSLVPSNSAHLYAFKITLNPVPEARSLSTGTIYVSTGLLSKVDNEAQLAYVLGHEIGHVEKNHWFEDVLVEHGLAEYNDKQQQKRSIIGGIANVGTGIVSGGLIRGGNMMGLTATMLAQYSVPTLMKVAVPNAVVTWDKQQEDEADQLGLQYMLARNYDPREVPKFYASLQNVARRDKRSALGFMASAARISDRLSFIGPASAGGVQGMMLVGAINLNMERQTEAMMQAATPPAEKPADTGKQMDPTRDAARRGSLMDRLISGAMSKEVEEKLSAGQLIGSPAEFLAVMAELKRDNGIRAYYYDMFQVARDDLEESLKIRDNDPAAHFYYGKVLKLTARTPGEKSRAYSEFAEAIRLDARRVLPEAYLQRALTLVARGDSTQMREIVNDLKEYVTLYQRQNAGRLPPNMNVIYDYMQDAGEMTWAATPAMNVSTKNIEPIGVASGGVGARPASQQQPAPAASSQPAPNTAPAPAKSQPRKRP